ncbi:MAG: hypothetical protein FWH18_07680 [Marinilabiliaceae bacterium]|nr:hypothetical protein [Marinilabiliaceae bacterium]
MLNYSLSDKKWLKLLLLSTIIVLLLFSCKKDSQGCKAKFDEKLLIGQWLLNDARKYGEYWLYNSNNRGKSWDENDDVNENEAQSFEWSLCGAKLELLHGMESSQGRIPKQYTITELTSKTLKYRDDYRSYSYTKVNTVRGRVTQNNSPLSGVLISASTGTTFNTDDNKDHENKLGTYTINVSPGSSVTITPSLTGYTFSPPNITINNVTSNHNNQNFTAIPVTQPPNY